jgi:glyoxylase-like metal-dependent hydrolase (beta-lactamase superfamily II)
MTPVDGHWVEVGGGVLARRYGELDLTVGLVVGSARALMIDTRGDVRQGRELAAAVRAVTPLPLVVAITHAHFDHCFGSAAFLPAPMYALPRCREVLAATAAAQRAEWTAHYRARGRHGIADDLAATQPPLPAATAPAVLDLGGREAHLLDIGRGHTNHDLIVHVPDADVVFAGDLVEQGAPPSLDDAVVAEWPATLTALLALDPRAVVPGHGDPVDTMFVTEQRDRLADVASLHAAVARGELAAATADQRSPYPGVRWPAPRPQDA